MEYEEIKQEIKKEFPNDEREFNMQKFYALPAVVRIINHFLEKQKT